MTNSTKAWKAQLPLAGRWTLVLPDRRGFVPNAPCEGCDFEVDAADIGPLIEDGAHVVGHSYGALAALWIADAHPELIHSLTLVEPPAHQLAIEDARVAVSIDRRLALDGFTTPEEFLMAFTEYVGGNPASIRLPIDPSTRQHILVQMNERLPWSEPLPTERIAKACVSTQIITGGHDEVFELVADRLAERLGTQVQRRVLPGAGHSVQRLGGPFNDQLEEFWRQVPTAEG
jgi:pimeloyl-ACP methyl ester carboxylesterase